MIIFFNFLPPFSDGIQSDFNHLYRLGLQSSPMNLWPPADTTFFMRHWEAVFPRSFWVLLMELQHWEDGPMFRVDLGDFNSQQSFFERDFTVAYIMEGLLCLRYSFKYFFMSRSWSHKYIIVHLRIGLTLCKSKALMYAPPLRTYWM